MRNEEASTVYRVPFVTTAYAYPMFNAISTI